MAPRKVSNSAAGRPKNGERLPLAAIRTFARQIAERFHPEKIVLFGSYAYGEPNEDSDVDLLVVMPARNQVSQAVRIRMALPDPPFPLDLIVRTPERLKKRLEDGDSLMREIIGRGTVLYEKGDGGMGSQGRGRLPRRSASRRHGSSIT
ncbi:MAG: nucleotidyltransferase domain-containing protein [Gemmataceae bacterium]